MRLKKYLNEDSYSQFDLPKNFFWVVFRLEEGIDSLKKGVLGGVTGISGNKEIVMDFLGIVRNAVLIMPAKEVEKLNKLSRVMYDNPYYLLQDNMKALTRIWEKERRIEGVIFNLFEYVTAYWKKSSKYRRVADDAEYFAFHQRLSYMAKNLKGINGPRDLAKWTKKATEQMYKEEEGKDFSVKHYLKSIKKLTLKDWEHSIIKGLEKVSEIYGGESEWIVKDKKLRIPKDSTLVVLKSRLSDMDYSFLDLMKDKEQGKIKVPEGMDDVEYLEQYRKEQSPQPKLIKKHGIDKKYKVKYVDNITFDKIKKKYLTRRYS